MKVGSFDYTCVNGHCFMVPGLSLYGQGIMWSLGLGTPKYINLMDDPVYAEIHRMLKLFPEFQHNNEEENADILQKIFGVACDPDDDGSEFKLGATPKCPKCGSREMKSWDVSIEPKIWDVLEITHNRWQKLSSGDKKDALYRRLEQLDFIKQSSV